MSRLSRRRSLTVVATTLVALAMPAAAHAATYTVKTGDGACGPGDLACGGLVEAAAIAAPGDVFNVATGTYPAPKFTTGGVTINGDLGVFINGTIQFAADTGGVSKLSKVTISQGTSAAPAVYVSGTSGLELSDAIAVSRDGFGIFVTAGTSNKIVRTGVSTGGIATGAIQVEAGPDSDDIGLTVESSILVGGGAGVRALSTANEAEVTAGRAPGNITLNLRHITAAGSSNGLDLDSSNARSIISGGVGNITATLTDSLAFNNRVANYRGVLNLGVLLGANSSTLTSTRSMETGNVNEFFLKPSNGNFRLLPTSPAIGQGSVTPGESATDIDGEDRSTAPTDLGGDEYNNAAPTAKIVLATATPRSTQPVTFDGRGSTDRDGQATIAEYRWRFSDGSAVNTTVPFVQHTFASEGDGAAGLVVVDKQGAASTEVVVTFKIVNGTPPGVAIVKPKANQTFRTYTTTTKTVTKNGKKRKVKTRKRTKIIIAGLSKANSGSMSRVLLTLQKMDSTKSKSKCRYYDARKGLLRLSCSRPRLITARLVKDSKSGEWTYGVPTKRPLSRGRWKVSAYGIDSGGAFGNSADAKAASLRFTVKK